MNLFITHLASDPYFFFTWILIVIFSICVHEYAHAYTALRLGDDTAAREGHLSLNPMVQMGPTSLFFLALIGIAWGSVPVAIERFQQRWAGAVVAAAGPIANLALCMAFGFLEAVFGLLFGDELAPEIRIFLRVGGLANGVLFVLNMLPVPMLDGWSVFAYFFPAMRRVSPGAAQHVTLLLIVAIFLTPLGAMIWTTGNVVARLFAGVFSLILGV